MGTFDISLRFGQQQLLPYPSITNTRQQQTMAVLNLERIVKKVTKSIKKRLAPCNKVVQDVHQEEQDENALNEALEARLMETIAVAPALETPITLQLCVASVSSSSASTPSSPISIDGSGWPVFNFSNLPQYQTRCQEAEAQMA